MKTIPRVKENETNQLSWDCAITGKEFTLRDYVFTINGGDIINDKNIKDTDSVLINKRLLEKLFSAKTVLDAMLNQLNK